MQMGTKSRSRLSKEELARYSRQIVLKDIGLEGQKKLKHSCVSIAGLGGLGCFSAIQLCTMGVGHLRIIDQDVVDLTNLHRQILYETADVGYPKVEVAQKRLKALNPNVEIEATTLVINEETATSVVEDADLVVDGLDHFAPRYALNRACVELKIPYIFGGAIESYGNVSTIIPEKTACLECFVGRQSDEGMPTCETVGILTPVLAMITSIQVREALNLLLGQTPLLANRVLFVDMGSMSFESYDIARRKNCPTCGTRANGSSLPLANSKVVELCGKDSFMVSPRHPLSLNLADAEDVLGKKYRIKLRSGFSVVFEYSGDVSVSLMKTGNSLINGAKSKEDAARIYDDLMRILSRRS